MYYPILRGKLNELLALRELAQLELKNFKPVIEPVKKDIKALVKTIQSLNSFSIKPYIIINPTIGEFSNNSLDLHEALTAVDNISFNTLYSINQKTEKYEDFLNIGKFGLFIQKGIDQELIDFSERSQINFIQNDTNPNIKKLIGKRVYYEDFFKKQLRNADYPIESPFSSLHSYYSEDKSIGFADYTITGDDFNEGGGPVYVVAIHISYIDDERFDELFIRHYLSENDGTPTNPGAKFKQALNQLILEYENKIIPLHKSFSIEEFKQLYLAEHFPGLGQIKKLSIKHHIETICDYLIHQESKHG